MPTNSEENKSQKPKPYAPAIALKYINEKLNISDLQLVERYGLSRTTMHRIRNGKTIARAASFYLSVFVDLLNEKRLIAERLGDQAKAQDIDYLLRDLLLLHFGIPLEGDFEPLEGQD